MRRNFYLLILFVFATLGAQAQLQIDKSIDLTGSGSDARIMGIKSVSDPEDAANATSVQTGALIYDDATGSGGNYLVTLSPAPTAYTTGMIVNFKANHTNSGAATLQVNGLTPAKSIKVGVTNDLASGDIVTNQMVSVIYDGTNFQLLSRGSSVSIPTTLPPSGAAGGDLTGTYPNPDIAANAVTTNEIANGTIVTADLAANSVTSNQIVDGTIVTADLAANSVTSNQIVDGTIVTADLAANSVTSSQIVDGTIVTADLAANSVTSNQILNGTIVAADIATGTITSNEIANGTITATDLANTGVTAGGPYNNVTVNAQGQVTAASNVAYLTGNQNITLSGDVTGSGTTAITTNVGRINGATLGTTTATAGNLLIGSGTQWVTRAVSGDATLSSNGVLTLNQNNNGYIKNAAVGANFTTGQSANYDITGNAEIGGALNVSGNVGIGTLTPGKKLEVNGDILTQGKLFQNTSAGVGSGAHGISWYRNDYVTWYDYMANAGSTAAPNGTAAPTDVSAGVTSWARRFNIENSGTYGWLFESGPNSGTAPTVKFAINASNGTFHSTGNGFVDGNLQVNGSAYWGNSLTRTETRADAGLQGNAGARSGFYETSAPSPAANWYPGANNWQHLLDVRHSNSANNYAMQFAGSFFDQKLYFRKTANSASTAWSEVMMTSMRRSETYHNFNIPSGGYTSASTYAWIPMPGGEGAIDVISTVAQPYTRSCSWTAPSSGRLVRFVIHAEDQNSNPAHEIAGRVAIAVNGTITTYTGQGFVLNQTQQAVIDIPVTQGGFSFNAGDLINVGINLADFSGNDGWIEDNDYFVSCVWMYNY